MTKIILQTWALTADTDGNQIRLLGANIPEVILDLDEGSVRVLRDICNDLLETMK